LLRRTPQEAHRKVVQDEILRKTSIGEAPGKKLDTEVGT
jgi:hypothetical protein